MKIKKYTAVILSAAVVLGIAVLAAADFLRTPSSYEREDFAMGSFVTQKIYGSGASETAQIIIDSINDLESNGISHNYESSLISQINDNAGIKAVECSDSVYNAVSLLQELSYMTDGAYNPLLGSVIELWNFDGGNQEVPSPDKIKEALSLCSPDNLVMDDETKSIMLKQQGCKLHLGSAGKGLACDIAYQTLSSSECTSAVIAVGGSVLVYGEKPEGGNWTVAVRDPFNPTSGSYIGFVTAEPDTFISTSGDYEKYFIKDGIKYHHILDSATGYPADSGITSVTVSCSSGLMSDALSTACFVLGYDESLKILEHYDAGAVFIFKDGSYKTAGDIDFTAYE